MTTPTVLARPTAPAYALRVPAGRLVSLDAFRGATILAMIVVNNPGTWSAVYPPLLHAPWHGWTPTDLIFPFFLFIVGVSIVLALSGRLARGVPPSEMVGKVVRRSAVLFGLGLFMAAFPFFTFAPEFGLSDSVLRIRIPGVLQRIALCYLAASLLVLYVRPRTYLATAAALLVGYWGLMTLVPVPGYGAGNLADPEANLGAYLDRLLLGDHLWTGTGRRWDPEGLLSTFPAIATTLLGVWAGRLFADKELDALERVTRLFVRGAALVVLGYVWNWFLPINKPIWTSSYAVFTAGLAMCGLGLCYWLVDVKGHRRWAFPFVVFGVNAIAVYVLSGLVAEFLGVVTVTGAGGTSQPLQGWIFEHLFLSVASPMNASLLYALTYVTLWFGAMYVLYRREIFIKV